VSHCFLNFIEMRGALCELTSNLIDYLILHDNISYLNSDVVI
jgi:hypothetical protein